MARLVAQWRRSGESQASFARRHHIPTWRFWYWCHKLARETETADRAPAPAFVPVQVRSEGNAPVIDIVLRSGERVQIAAGASPALVQAVVTTLRSRC
jgi:hypothetical protein